MVDHSDGRDGAASAGHETELTAEAVERRAILRRFGAYAAFTAPALTVLMASRQSEAGSFKRNGNSDHGGGSVFGGGGGGGGGGGCAFSC